MDAPLEAGTSTTPHRPEDPLLIRVAFASERHARAALAALRGRPDLFRTAQLYEGPSPSGDLAMIDIDARHETRDRVVTLTQGMHGIVIGFGDRLPNAPSRDRATDGDV